MFLNTGAAPPGRHRAARTPTPARSTRARTPPLTCTAPRVAGANNSCSRDLPGAPAHPPSRLGTRSPRPSPGAPPPGRPDAGALIRVSTPLRPVRRHELSISGPSRRAGSGRRRPPRGAPLAPPHPRAGCHPTQLPRSVRSLSAWIRVVARPEPTEFKKKNVRIRYCRYPLTPELNHLQPQQHFQTESK